MASCSYPSGAGAARSFTEVDRRRFGGVTSHTRQQVLHSHWSSGRRFAGEPTNAVHEFDLRSSLGPHGEPFDARRGKHALGDGRFDVGPCQDAHLRVRCDQRSEGGFDPLLPDVEDRDARSLPALQRGDELRDRVEGAHVKPCIDQGAGDGRSHHAIRMDEEDEGAMSVVGRSGGTLR